MDKLPIWLCVVIAVVVALAANSLSTVWASKDDKFTIWLVLLVLLSPFVFITFGLVTSRLGLALTSGTVDSLLTIGTIIVGLLIFREWDQISVYQYVGITFAVTGIILMQFHK